MTKLHFLLCILPAVCLTAPLAYAEVYRGIDFPDGEVSFADELIRYAPTHSGGPAPTNANYLDPDEALGIPDYHAPYGSVSLGRGGLIELRFIDNRLTNSGSADHDLHIFEVGPDVEDTFVAIKPTPATAALLGPAFDANGDGYYEVGKVYGSTSSIDIDALFPGFEPGTLVFHAVQLIDDYNEGGGSGSTVDADIDAVGAIESVVLDVQCPCLGDINQDGWVSPSDISNLVSALLPYASSYYWVPADAGECADMDRDDWLSPSDISAIVSELLPYSSTYYWVQCPED